MGLVASFYAFVDRPERVPDDGPAVTYRCMNCDNEIRIDRDQSLPPCLICKGYSWELKWS
jgi:hypothetical protein